MPLAAGMDDTSIRGSIYQLDDRVREITEDEALERLRSKISYNCKIKDLAAEFGVTPAFMSMVLSGKRPITGAMLEAIGMGRRVIYFEIIGR